MKSYLYRQAAFGRQVAVLDPKGEYGGLARALGAEPIALSPAGRVRINPLDERALPVPRRTTCDIAGSCCWARWRRPLCTVALLPVSTWPSRSASTRRSPAAAYRRSTTSSKRSFSRGDEVAASLHVTAATLGEDGRDVGLELRRLVRGDLAGMFDGETSPSLVAGGRLGRRARRAEGWTAASSRWRSS